MNYNEIRKVVQQKKINSYKQAFWPNEVPKKHNTELEPPYTEEEIKNSEDIIGERFPEEFRDYLLYVSRETIYEVGKENETVYLPTSQIGICNIDKHITNIRPKDARISYVTPDDLGGCIVVGCGCCACIDYIVLKGAHKGSIWELSDFGLRLIYKSFNETYIDDLYSANPFAGNADEILYV